MLLTIFLAIVFCASITLILISAVAFVQDIKLFSSAPKEARDVLVPRENELFKGARIMGWALMIFSIMRAHTHDDGIKRNEFAYVGLSKHV